jgi:DNA-directed RNA polymerase beta' subunit
MRFGLSLEPVGTEAVRARSMGKVTQELWSARDPRNRRNGLFSTVIFGPGFEDPEPERDRSRVDVTPWLAGGDPTTDRWGHIELGVAVPHPITGTSIDAIAVLPPAYRPIEFRADGQFAASDLNDLYQLVIGRAEKVRRLAMLDEGLALAEATELARCVTWLFVNPSADPWCTPKGRRLWSLADVLALAPSRDVLKSLLWALGYEARWSG